MNIEHLKFSEARINFILHQNLPLILLKEFANKTSNLIKVIGGK